MSDFNVQGMTCGHCARAITQAVQGADSNAQVKVDLAAKRVQVQSGLSDDQVIALIVEEGYSAQRA